MSYGSSPTSTLQAPRTVPRGAPLFGADVGIVLLDTDIPRPFGDVGNARTFPFTVSYEVAEGVGPRNVVEKSAVGSLDALVRAGERLVARGARGIATCCGFLALYQRELASSLAVPVAASSLVQIPEVFRLIGADARIAVLTINAETLLPAHFDAAGVDELTQERITVGGLQNSKHFYAAIMGDNPVLDVDLAKSEIVDACMEMVRADPAVRGFVFECTNLPPYAPAVRAATGLPVWDAVSLIEWLHYAVRSEAVHP